MIFHDVLFFANSADFLRIRFPEMLPDSVSHLYFAAEQLDVEEYEDIALTSMPVSLWSIVEEELHTYDLTEATAEQLQLDILNYNHHDLSYIWGCFLCPASLLIRQFLLERHPLWDRVRGTPSGLGRNADRVLPAERVLDIYQKILALASRYEYSLFLQYKMFLPRMNS